MTTNVQPTDDVCLDLSKRPTPNLNTRTSSSDSVYESTITLCNSHNGLESTWKEKALIPMYTNNTGLYLVDGWGWEISINCESGDLQLMCSKCSSFSQISVNGKRKDNTLSTLEALKHGCLQVSRMLDVIADCEMHPKSNKVAHSSGLQNFPQGKMQDRVLELEPCAEHWTHSIGCEMCLDDYCSNNRYLWSVFHYPRFTACYTRSYKDTICFWLDFIWLVQLDEIFLSSFFLMLELAAGSSAAQNAQKCFVFYWTQHTQIETEWYCDTHSHQTMRRAVIRLRLKSCIHSLRTVVSRKKGSSRTEYSKQGCLASSSTHPTIPQLLFLIMLI